MTLLPNPSMYGDNCPCCGAPVSAHWKTQTGPIYCSVCSRGEHDHNRRTD
ncbi:MAG: hypothetical protein ABR525_07455 [Candidatus Limnocylindria bacterium]